MATEMAAAGASSIATKAAESFYDIAQSRISYVFKYKRYVEELRKQVELLKRKKELIEQDVRHARRRGDGIYNSVEIWQGKVRGVIERVEKSINEEEEEKAQKKRCLSGLCPNLMTRYNLSKEAVKASKDVVDLLKEADDFKFDIVSYPLSPERRQFLNDIEGCQQFDSRRKVFWDVINELKESKSNRIGVYGMGGVGKTTLAKQVAKEVMEVKLFDEVVMAEVTETPDVKTIQDQISYGLGLILDQNLSSVERSNKLCQRLKKEKRVLVILDNIWGKFNLEAVGIPSGVDNVGQCTILFTSRNLDVLCTDMNSKKTFPIDVLCDIESMDLFWESVDDDLKKTPDRQSLAVEIVGILGGLPLAIKTIANALKAKSSRFWERALIQLRTSRGQLIHGMGAEVYESIKLSYDYLQSEEIKSLFQLCALQKDGSRISIDDLIMHSMGLHLFTNVYPLKERRSMVHLLIENLKSLCLLMDGDTEDVVKMHDIVHTVAVSIAKEKHMLNIRNVDELKEEEENGIQQDATAISLPYTDIQRLPERLKYPNLKLFLLFAKRENSFQIPDLFLEGMTELRVLHMSELCLLSLPSSLGYLVSLRTLLLINCYSLKDIALLGELKKLEILSFRDSDIEKLPVEIGQLTQLRLLDLGMCTRLTLIVPNVISKLSRLEELYMGNSFTRWGKVEGQESNASLVELKELSNLKALDIRIPDIEVMPQNLFFVELERYKISIGDDVYFWDWSSRYETSRSLKLQGIDNNYLGYRIQLLMKTVEDLCLDTSNGFQSVFRGLDAEGFPLLKHLFIQNSPEISYIVHSVERINCNAFPLLESLFLYKLITLEKICQGQLREDQSFSKLRIIKVEECHRLKHLFSFSMAKNLLQLQEIQVIDCNDLKMIFGKESEIHLVHENEHCSRIDFTQLRSLSLKWLPQLTSSGFDLERSVEESTITAASQEIIAEDDLKTLFNNMVIFPCVEKLKLSNINIEKIWLDQLPAMSSCSQYLTKLTVEECHNLKYLFSPSMVNSLVELQELAISRCKSIERVIDIRLLGTEEEAIEMVFPKLIRLELFGLPNLTTFGIGNSIKFPSLRQLDIADCQNLERFISTSTLAEGMSFKENIHSDIQLAFFDEKVAFPRLEKLQLYELSNLIHIWKENSHTCNVFQSLRALEVSRCEMLETIIELPVGEEVKDYRIVFNQLEYLKLHGLPRLRNFCLGNYKTLEFPYLKEVAIYECPNIKKILVSSEDFQQPLFLVDPKVAFPRLEELRLLDLPNLVHIWKENSHTCNVFQNLRTLEIDDCEMLETIIELQVGEEVKDYRIVFNQLEYLKLNGLPRLRSFCLGNYKTLEFPYLKEVFIYECPNIKKIFASSADFQQPLFLADPKVAFPTLEKLKLSGLSNLVHIWKKENSHTCNVFQSLRTLDIYHCEMLENIIELQAGEEVKYDRIVFNQLESLELSYLPRLRSFCTGNYKTLEFPYLKEVFIYECPNMQIFSDGVLHTPKLHKVKYTYGEEGRCSEDNLNSTIQKMFEEMVGFDGIDSLKLSEFPQAKEKWHSQALPISFFRYLSSLVVDNCTFMLSAIPANLLRFLNNLETLEVRNCDSVEEVFHLEEVNADGHFGRLFPKLERLVLLDLPKLKRFCNFTKDIIELPNLFHLLIENCPNMEKFISDSTQVDIIANKEPKEMTSESKEINIMADIQPLFDEKVVSLYLKELKLSKLPKLLHLCKENSHPNNVFQNLEILEVSECHKLEKLVPSATSFNSLKTLKVSKCDGLINLVTLITSKSLGDLEEMKITDCKMMEEIIELQVEEEVKEDPIVFSQLEYLELDGLPSLKCFYLGNYTLEFPNLEKVIVKKCLKMKIFSLRALRTPKLQRLHLVELEDEGRWEGDLNTTIQKLFKQMNVQDIKEEDMSIERILNIQ